MKALPAHSSKTKSALKKLGKEGLERLLAEAQQPSADAAASTVDAPVEDTDTES